MVADIDRPVTVTDAALAPVPARTPLV